MVLGSARRGPPATSWRATRGPGVSLLRDCVAHLVAHALSALRIRCAFGLLLECCCTVLADALCGRLDRGVNSITSRQNRVTVSCDTTTLALRRMSLMVS